MYYRRPDDFKQQLKTAQARLEYQRQIEIVKLELGKLTKMKSDHEDIFENFLRLIGSHHDTICKLIEKVGIDKWFAYFFIICIET